MLNDQYYGLRLNDHFPSSRLLRRLKIKNPESDSFESLLVDPSASPPCPDRPRVLLVLSSAACLEDSLFAARLLGHHSQSCLHVAFSDGGHRLVPASSVAFAFSTAVVSHCKHAPVLLGNPEAIDVTDFRAVVFADASDAEEVPGAASFLGATPMFFLGPQATPALDNMAYFDRRGSRDMRRGACVYYMPSQKRRLPCLAIRVVEGLSWIFPDYPIRVFGEDRCKFPCGRAVRFCGALLDPYDRADLYADCELGIVLSEGAPCRTCYEMRACGLMVVDVNPNLLPREQFQVLEEANLLEGIARLLGDPSKRQFYQDNLSEFAFESADALSMQVSARIGLKV